MNINKILNEYNLEHNLKNISSINIDTFSGFLGIKFKDELDKEHIIELKNVDNYQIIDTSIYNKMNEFDLREKNVNFLDDLGAKFEFFELGEGGEVLSRKSSTPNFIVDTDSRSILADAEKIKINGKSYKLR